MTEHVKPKALAAAAVAVENERTARKRRYALELAKLGFHIIPLQPETKIPYSGESWAQIATTDPATITALFASRPRMNYGVCPGEHHAIIDPDVKTNKKGVKKDGLRDLQEIADDAFEPGAFSETFTVQTPSGGEHRYFTTDSAVSNSNEGFPPSVDVRGKGGYVVGPGCHTSHNAASGTHEGEYTVVLDRPIAPFPVFAVSRLRKWEPSGRYDQRYDEIEIRNGKEYVGGVELDTPGNVEDATRWLTTKARPAIEGEGGNSTTFATFAWLREHAISEVKAFHLVNELYNPHCQPEWSFEELGRICENAFRYAKRQVGSLSERFADEIESEEAPSPRVHDGEVISGDLDAHTFCGEEIFKRPQKKEFVIPGVLPASGYTGFLARRGTGKSTLLLDMMLRLGHDMDWHGKPAQKGWVVAYLAGEDAEGVADQVAAWKLANGVTELDHDRIIFTDEIVDLLDGENVEKWTKHLQRKARGRRCIVIGDTWQTATAKGSQNEDDRMQTAIRHIKQIAKALNGPAIMAAHPPKQNEDTWSGSAVLENGSQALWKLTDETTHLKFSVTRIKGARAGFYALFKFEEYALGERDQWGQPLTGLVPLKIGGEGSPMETDERNRLAAFKQSVADAIAAIMWQAEEANDRTPWSGKRMSKALMDRHAQHPLTQDPASADQMARNFSPWFFNKRVPITTAGPHGERLAVTAKKGSGNGYYFEIVGAAADAVES